MKARWLRTVVRGLVGALLFAQMAIAAYACPALSSTVAPAMQMPASFAAPMPDCDAMTGAMDPSAANLCAEHCKYGQQSDQASTLTVPAVSLSVLSATAFVAEPRRPQRAAAASLSALVAACPPHTLLHCVYRI